MDRRLKFNKEPTHKVTITKVGFVATLPSGEPLIHDWEFTEYASYTVDELREISRKYYGDRLEYYHKLSPYGLWGTVS